MAEEKEKKDSERNEKYEKLRKTAYFYYKRKDIQKAIFNFSKEREVIPHYYNIFGKRPDMLQYESDVSALAEKGMTSLHCSEELWKDPLQLSTEMNVERVNDLRAGWDLLLDIDCKFIEFSKIAAEMLVEALKFNNTNNIGVKFSGGSGFHIGIAWQAFPQKIYDIEIKNFFPEGPRFIASYLKEMISETLGKKILELSSIEQISKITGKKEAHLFKEKKFDPFSVLEIDTILISPRHLFRMPYSLHERTMLASIVIKPEQIKEFQPGWASPQRVFPKPFLPEPEENEAKELIMQAFDFGMKTKKLEEIKQVERKEIIIKNLSPGLYPPCIKNILAGIKSDGRKRALFILLNFFKSLNIPETEIEKMIEEWNKLNYKKLKEGYIKTQISWHLKQKKILPPNCDKPNYKDIAVCTPDSMCRLIKNPVNYAVRRARLSEVAEEQEEKGRRRKKRD